MAGVKTITAANAVYMLSIVGLFDTPVQLQGFTADAAFSGDERKPLEVVQGVDGGTSMGFVFSLYKQKISLMPDGDSYTLFEEWLSAMESQQEIYVANATIVIPSIQRKYTLTKGGLSSAKPIPDVKKTVAGSDFEITWTKVVGVPT